MAHYNTVPHDEGLLLKKKKQHWTGIAVAAAAVSFTLGLVAAVATAPPVKPAETMLNGWKTPFMDENWWHRPGLSWRTVSPSCWNEWDGYPKDVNLMDYVDTLEAAGVGALTLNSVYDSGYREGVDRGGEKKLWCGLGLSEHLNVNPAIGGRDASVRELADKLHGKGMALMTWVNPSYFWTGSAHFKQAEADMWNAGGDMSQTPDDSPARWFKWGPLEWGEVDKPGDDVYLDDSGTWRWVKDHDANAAYLSVWADQPSTDFTSEGWQNELDKFFRRWINLGVDGFILDDPDGYINAGTDNHATKKWEGYWEVAPWRIKQYVTDVVRKHGKGKVAAFGELYDEPENAVAYGLDGSIGDGNPDWRNQKVQWAVDHSNSNGLDDAFGGIDGIIAQCYFTYGTKDQWCAVAMSREEAVVAAYGENNKPSQLALSLALTSGAGGRPDIEWWDRIFPGPKPAPAKMKNVFEVIANSWAFSGLSLRTPLDVDQDDAYALMRYDALFTGEVGIAVYNLAGKKRTISVTMPAAAIGATATSMVNNQKHTLEDTYEVTLKPYSYEFLADIWPGTWSSHGYKNCFQGQGASWGSDSQGTMSIAACFDTCLESDCEGVTVAWGASGNVECFLRKGIDTSNCLDGNTGDTWYTTFTRD